MAGGAGGRLCQGWLCQKDSRTEVPDLPNSRAARVEAVLLALYCAVAGIRGQGARGHGHPCCLLLPS